jgi:SAM-dependent methyltransferase
MRMRSSQPLFDALAPTYHEHFEVPHRRAYDDLAWERVEELLPQGGPVVDAGCGVGRWARQLLAAGYDVIGIEQAPRMVAELRRSSPGASFTLLEQSMDSADLPEASVGMVLAMGSLQYTAEPQETVRRFARWVRPGGVVAVLVDSLIGLVVELLRAGKGGEALERARTRMGVWSVDAQEADLHLLDRARLERIFERAGLEQVEVCGLLVTGTALGREELAACLAQDREAHLLLERELLREAILADLGKHLLAFGRRSRDSGGRP